MIIFPDVACSVATGYLFRPVTAVQTLHSICFIEIDAHLYGDILNMLETQQLQLKLYMWMGTLS